MTHNMVDAMGTGGLEGMLSSACEITNRVMRSHTEQLVSVLKPFLYDPLVMWTGRDTKADENSEMTNDQVYQHIIFYCFIIILVYIKYMCINLLFLG